MTKDAQLMEEGGDRSHDPREHLSRRGQTKARIQNCQAFPSAHEPERLATRWVNWHLKVRVRQVDRDHPTVSPNRMKNRAGGLHTEPRLHHRQVQGGGVDDDRSPPSRRLGDHEHAAVIP